MAEWFEVAARSSNVKFPSRCASCLSNAPISALLVADRRHRLEVDVPYCPTCAQKALRWQRRKPKFVLALILYLFFSALTLEKPELFGLLLALGFWPWIGLWLGLHVPATVKVCVLGDQSFMFGFRSDTYARSFLDVNPTAFEPERRWRWVRFARKWLSPAVGLVAVYCIYLALVLPFARTKDRDLVLVLGVLLAFGVMYMVARLGLFKS